MVNEQNVTEYEDFEDAESSHSTRRRKTVDKGKDERDVDDQSFGNAESSRSTTKRRRMNGT
jgi:hypothetical protein